MGGPFLVYAFIVYKAAPANAPEGFVVPRITDFWKAFVGAIVTQIAKMGTMKMLYPFFCSVTKEEAKNDPKLRHKHANKAAEYGFCVLQYIVASIWGFIVLRKTKHLPWFMGGSEEMTASF